MNNQPVSHLSRRDFLKVAGAGTAAACMARLMPGGTTAALASRENGPTFGMLIDLTRCTGCNSCALACKTSNGLPEPDVAPSALSSEAFTFVDQRQITAPDGQSATRFVKRQCMHCLDAACVAACPAAAMTKSKEGPVTYRADVCLGCRYCQLACPFEVPRFEWDDGVTPEISKCWLCNERLKEGQKPACAEACPTGALRFGLRSALLAQAHGQINSHPDRYVDHVFGEHEVGGTSMLYLSDVPFDQLGFPVNLPHTAPPEETEKIMSKLPLVIGGVATVMTGSAVYTHRQREHVNAAPGTEVVNAEVAEKEIELDDQFDVTFPLGCRDRGYRDRTVVFSWRTPCGSAIWRAVRGAGCTQGLVLAGANRGGHVASQGAHQTWRCDSARGWRRRGVAAFR